MTEFRQYPIPDTTATIRAISLLDYILVLLIDDCQINCIDTFSSWSKEILRVNIANNCSTRILKVAEKQFILKAMLFRLYDA